MKKHDKKDRNKDFVRFNEQIRVPKVRVIEGGQNLGVMSTRDALKRARSAGLDLVEVAAQAKPPVASIMDYGKYMYEKAKRKKDASKAAHNEEKEIRFRYVIDSHDLENEGQPVSEVHW